MELRLSIDGFDELTEVGWGGFSVVFRARQRDYNREVALKVLSVQSTRASVDAFERECAAIGSLSGHPSVVTIHGVGETADGRPFMVMEFLHGGSLGDRLRFQGPLGWREVAEIGIRLAGALESAHRAGILHRDVKPENVLVSRFGEPKLGDFGVARLHGGVTTGSGGIVGTLGHAAPEVLGGHAPTVRSDIYSLGSTLFTLLNGTPPFPLRGDEGLLGLLARISTETPEDLRPSGVPDGLCGVIEQALDKDPADRQASAEAVGRQLQGLLAALETDPPPAVTVQSAGPQRLRPARRWRWLAASITGVAVVATAVLLRPGAEPEQPRSRPTTTANAERVVHSDDFSAPGGVRAGAGDEEQVPYVDGQFRILVREPGKGAGRTIVTPVAEAAAGVRVEVDVDQRLGSSGKFGVATGHGPGPCPYLALIESNGSWELNLFEGEFTRRVQTGTSPAIRTAGPNRIKAECRREGAGSRVRLFVNDELVGGHAEPSVGEGARLALLFAFSEDQPVEVRFDNLVVTSL